MDNWTEIICIIDRSGSMRALETDTIGGFNAFVERQRKEPGRARLSLVLFDHEYEMLWQNVDVLNVPELNEKLYSVRGNTALLDAVGNAVCTIRGQIQRAVENERPSNVVVLVVTDGYENASREYGLESIRALVEETQNEGWQYVFLGADNDAFGAAREMSMRSGTSSQFAKSSAGMREAYGKMNRAVTDVRRTGRTGDVDDDLGDDDLL